MTGKSVLIIGATGDLGVQCLRHLAEEPAIDLLHIFCRHPHALTSSDRALCDSIVLGDAYVARDVADAILKTAANVVILATADCASVQASHTRHATAKALAETMRLPDFQHIKAVVVSSVGAGESHINVGLGIGQMLAHHKSHALADYSRQELEFADLMDRTMIVRPTFLTNNKPGKTIIQFGNRKKAPSFHCDRSDLAAWIAKEVAKDHDRFRNGTFNLTSSKYV